MKSRNRITLLQYYILTIINTILPKVLINLDKVNTLNFNKKALTTF